MLVHRRGAWLLVLSLMSFPFAAEAAREAEIGPGPTEMSAEERSLAADPKAGVEHAVILVEEMNLDENLSSGSATKVSFHLRAKILSLEARDLANVVIPYNFERGKLKRWWGRTILPDGEVLELSESDLEEQTIIEERNRWYGYSVRKAALPGVVPGCIIDYGYEMRIEGFAPLFPVPLQRSWPVKALHYRWTPWQGAHAAYLVAHGEGLDIQVATEKRTMDVRARSLPAVKHEDYGPPATEIRATLLRYYRENDEPDAQAFWNEYALRREQAAKRFMRGKKELAAAVARLEIPPDADLHGKLRVAYDWIGDNIENLSILSSEEREAHSEEDAEEAETIREVLDSSRARSWQLDLLFLAFARALGAEAHIVMVVDRTEHWFTPGLLDSSQFDSRLIAVRTPGQALGEAIFVDAGSGLPYGQVPWWLSGVPGVICAREGAGTVLVKSSDVNDNVMESRASLRFSEENGSLEVSWSREGSGQAGYSERRYLRRLDPDDREDRLFELCGASSELEIVRAAVPGFNELAADYRLDCEGEFYDAYIDEEVDHYHHSIAGPWIQELPELTDEKRAQPMIFSFPRVERLLLDVGAPAGFRPGPAPEPIEIDSEFGRYRLTITATETGHQVKRVLVLPLLGVPAEVYEGLVAFVTKIREADRTPVEFLREEGP